MHTQDRLNVPLRGASQYPAVQNKMAMFQRAACLPPKMKRVQRAARTARACGSGTQAPGSEAVS